MKVGLFFGSFNPIHIGHLAIANYMVEFGPIDVVWFVVTPHNPLKNKNTLINNHSRLNMVNIAINGDDRFQACDVEFLLPQPSYTINTLYFLHKKHPEHTFSIIMGADNFISIKKWFRWETIVNNYEILVYPRPGCNIDSSKLFPKTNIIDAPNLEISSTFLRESLSDNKDIRHFLPNNVYQHICDEDLYGHKKTIGQ